MTAFAPQSATQAQTGVTAPPSITYLIENAGTPSGPGLPGTPETVLFTFNGYILDHPPTPADDKQFSLYAIAEADFEHNFGGQILSVVDVTKRFDPSDTGNWFSSVDLTLSTPTNPIRPRDPQYFEITSTIPQVFFSGGSKEIHLYDQPFFFYNYLPNFPPGYAVKTDAGLIGLHPLNPNGTIPTPAAAIPEPASVQSALLGGAALLGLMALRRRKARS